MAQKAVKHKTGKVLHDLFREVFKVHAALSNIMDRVHEQAGLSTSQIKIMRVLSRIGPATVPDIATVLGVSRQFVQTVCNNLLSCEFVELAVNPRHKRSKLVALTEYGWNAFRQARKNENKIIEQALPGIDPVKATEACKLLESIRSTVQKSQE